MKHSSVLGICAVLVTPAAERVPSAPGRGGHHARLTPAGAPSAQGASDRTGGQQPVTGVPLAQ